MKTLEWQNPPHYAMTWDKAMKYAKALGDGWRLPTRGELLDAYDNKMEGFIKYLYWTSSRDSEFPNAYAFCTITGDMYNADLPDLNYVRCVKDIKNETTENKYKILRVRFEKQMAQDIIRAIYSATKGEVVFYSEDIENRDIIKICNRKGKNNENSRMATKSRKGKERRIE